MLPEFNLLMPKTLSEALEMLADPALEAMPIAGGTNLVVDMRSGYHKPKTVVNIEKLEELHGVRQENGHIVIGGGVTVAELLNDPLIAQQAPVLKEAAAAFANTLIRNRATVGGNLVNAAPCADTAPPLLVLDAEVELASTEGVRCVRLEEFLIDAFTTMRQPHELLTTVRWPVSPPNSAGAFHKLGLRKVSCMAKVDVAVLVEGDGNGGCREARIALGAVAPQQVRAHAAEDLLRGQPLNDEIIAEAARLAAEAAQPRSGSEYKLQAVKGLTRRLLVRAAKEIK